MRIQFVKEDYLLDYPIIADLDVNEDLTEEEVEKIYDYIFRETESLSEDDEDSTDDDYWLVCYHACKAIIPNKLIENKVVKTFYIK